jgi:hypothetical protein
MTNTRDMTIGSFDSLPVAGPLVAQVRFSSSNFSEGFLELRAALRLKPHLDGLTDRRRVRSWKATPECLSILREGLPGVTPGDCSASGLPKQAPTMRRGVADAYEEYTVSQSYDNSCHKLIFGAACRPCTTAGAPIPRQRQAVHSGTT